MKEMLPDYMMVTFSLYMFSPSAGLGIEYRLLGCRFIDLEADAMERTLKLAKQELNSITKRNDARPMTLDEVTAFLAETEAESKEAANGSRAPRNLLS